ncbi:MAG: glycine cleavage T C-terminal barrel domain-containing protein, partial [Sulfolobales archaeon]
GFIDDVMVYKVNEEEFFIVTNAINREKVIKWIKNNSSLDVEDLTFDYGMIAIQGRRVWDLIPSIDLEKLSFKLNTEFMGNEVFLISRSGWTGEDGLEIWAKEDSLKNIFKKLIDLGVRPAGLIARDSLRLEMGFVLYGEDIDENINPIEARYPVFSLKKDFIGKNAIIEYIKSGVNKFRIGFKVKKGERSIPRHGDKIYILDQEIGEITSGTFSPYLQRSIAMGYLNSNHFYLGFSINIITKAKKMIEAKIQDFPFI